MRSLLRLMALAAALTILPLLPAKAQNVDAGLWWSPANPGWGLAIDEQNGALVVIAYTYDSSGTGIWYFTNGFMSSRTTYSGPAQTFRGGQCAGCTYTAPSVAGELGTVTFTFTPALTGAPATTGNVSLNGGTYAIERFNFNLGDFPHRMLGQWAFVSRVNGVAAAAIFTFTRVGTATTGGTGRFLTADGLTIGQCYSSGSIAGLCEIGNFSSSGALQLYMLFDPRVTNSLVGLYLSNGQYWPTLGFRTAARRDVTSVDVLPDMVSAIPEKAEQFGNIPNEIKDPRFLVTQTPGWADDRAKLLKE